MPAAVDFLLIHGGWHGSAVWSKVGAYLTRRGHRVLAIDLPGHGLNANFPAAYFTRERSALPSQPSACADLSLDDAADAVIGGLGALEDSARPTVAVAHSVGGAALTRAAEKEPASADHLVYVAAYLPTHGSVGDVAAVREAENPDLNSLYVGDPAQLGAFRLDLRSDDTSYVRRLKSVFCADASANDFLAWRNSLTPDLPLRFAIDPVDATASRWGSVPRTYIACSDDRAIPIALQQVMIDDADTLTPDNPTRRLAMPGSHSPMLVRPGLLARYLEDAAAGEGVVKP